jgi:tRNA(fMet)-specific endonuclease VapC
VLVELVHGIYRADTPELRAQRKAYIEEFLADVPVYPLTKRIAFLAGQIDAEQKSRGISIPFQDLLIGATALQLGFAVVTLNTRHFQLIPGLKIFQL